MNHLENNLEMYRMFYCSILETNQTELMFDYVKALYGGL